MVLQLLLLEQSPTTHEMATRRKRQWGKLILMRRKENAQRQKSKPAYVVSGNHLVLWDTEKAHSEELSHTHTFLELSLKLFLLKSSLTQHNMDNLHVVSLNSACLQKIEELAFSVFFQTRTLFLITGFKII